MLLFWVILMLAFAVAMAVVMWLGGKTCRESQKDAAEWTFTFSLVNIVLVLAMAFIPDESMRGVLFFVFVGIGIYTVIEARRLGCFHKLRILLGK